MSLAGLKFEPHTVFQLTQKFQKMCSNKVYTKSGSLKQSIGNV